MKKSDFFFDDCPICQAMKKAEEEKRNLGYPELRQAFLKAKEGGAVVGGRNDPCPCGSGKKYKKCHGK